MDTEDACVEVMEAQTSDLVEKKDAMTTAVDRCESVAEGNGPEENMITQSAVVASSAKPSTCSDEVPRSSLAFKPFIPPTKTVVPFATVTFDKVAPATATAPVATVAPVAAVAETTSENEIDEFRVELNESEDEDDSEGELEGEKIVLDRKKVAKEAKTTGNLDEQGPAETASITSTSAALDELSTNEETESGDLLLTDCDSDLDGATTADNTELGIPDMLRTDVDLDKEIQTGVPEAVEPSSNVTLGPLVSKSQAISLTCDICDKLCATAYGLREHKKEHVTRITCIICPVNFTMDNIRVYFKHLQRCIRRVHPKRIAGDFYCCLCSCTEKMDIRMYNNHLLLKHVILNLDLNSPHAFCVFCGAGFRVKKIFDDWLACKAANFMLTHAKKHCLGFKDIRQGFEKSGKRAMECYFCDEVFDDFDALLSHSVKVHTVERCRISRTEPLLAYEHAMTLDDQDKILADYDEDEDMDVYAPLELGAELDDDANSDEIDSFEQEKALLSPADSCDNETDIDNTKTTSPATIDNTDTDITIVQVTSQTATETVPSMTDSIVAFPSVPGTVFIDPQQNVDIFTSLQNQGILDSSQKTGTVATGSIPCTLDPGVNPIPITVSTPFGLVSVQNPVRGPVPVHMFGAPTPQPQLLMIGQPRPLGYGNALPEIVAPAAPVQVVDLTDESPSKDERPVQTLVGEPRPLGYGDYQVLESGTDPARIVNLTRDGSPPKSANLQPRTEQRTSTPTQSPIITSAPSSLINKLPNIIAKTIVNSSPTTATSQFSVQEQAQPFVPRVQPSTSTSNGNQQHAFKLILPRPIKPSDAPILPRSVVLPLISHLTSKETTVAQSKSPPLVTNCPFCSHDLVNLNKGFRVLNHLSSCTVRAVGGHLLQCPICRTQCNRLILLVLHIHEAHVRLVTNGQSLALPKPVHSKLSVYVRQYLRYANNPHLESLEPVVVFCPSCRMKFTELGKDFFCHVHHCLFVFDRIVGNMCGLQIEGNMCGQQIEKQPCRRSDFKSHGDLIRHIYTDHCSLTSPAHVRVLEQWMAFAGYFSKDIVVPESLPTTTVVVSETSTSAPGVSLPSPVPKSPYETPITSSVGDMVRNIIASVSARPPSPPKTRTKPKPLPPQQPHQLNQPRYTVMCVFCKNHVLVTEGQDLFKHINECAGHHAVAKAESDRVCPSCGLEFPVKEIMIQHSFMHLETSEEFVSFLQEQSDRNIISSRRLLEFLENAKRWKSISEDVGKVSVPQVRVKTEVINDESTSEHVPVPVKKINTNVSVKREMVVVKTEPLDDWSTGDSTSANVPSEYSISALETPDVKPLVRIDEVTDVSETKSVASSESTVVEQHSYACLILDRIVVNDDGSYGNRPDRLKLELAYDEKIVSCLLCGHRFVLSDISGFDKKIQRVITDHMFFCADQVPEKRGFQSCYLCPKESFIKSGGKYLAKHFLEFHMGIVAPEFDYLHGMTRRGVFDAGDFASCRIEVRGPAEVRKYPETVKCSICGDTLRIKRNDPNYLTIEHVFRCVVFGEHSYRTTKTCPECGPTTGFKNVDDLIHHILTKHMAVRTFYEPGCEATDPGGEWSEQEILSMVVKRRTRLDTLLSNAVKSHYRYTHSSSNPYECTRCNSVFTKKKFIFMHIDRGCDGKPVNKRVTCICGFVCGEATAKKRLSIHVAQCRFFANASDAEKRDLLKYLPNTLVQCSLCGMWKSDSHKLRHHRKSCKGPKPKPSADNWISVKEEEVDSDSDSAKTVVEIQDDDNSVMDADPAVDAQEQPARPNQTPQSERTGLISCVLCNAKLHTPRHKVKEYEIVHHVKECAQKVPSVDSRVQICELCKDKHPGFHRFRTYGNYLAVHILEFHMGIQDARRYIPKGEVRFEIERNAEEYGFRDKARKLEPNVYKPKKMTEIKENAAVLRREMALKNPSKRRYIESNKEINQQDEAVDDDDDDLEVEASTYAAICACKRCGEKFTYSSELFYHMQKRCLYRFTLPAKAPQLFKCICGLVVGDGNTLHEAVCPRYRLSQALLKEAIKGQKTAKRRQQNTNRKSPNARPMKLRKKDGAVPCPICHHIVKIKTNDANCVAIHHVSECVLSDRMSGLLCPKCKEDRFTNVEDFIQHILGAHMTIRMSGSVYFEDDKSCDTAGLDHPKIRELMSSRRRFLSSLLSDDGEVKPLYGIITDPGPYRFDCMNCDGLFKSKSLLYKHISEGCSGVPLKDRKIFCLCGFMSASSTGKLRLVNHINQCDVYKNADRSRTEYLDDFLPNRRCEFCAIWILNSVKLRTHLARCPKKPTGFSSSTAVASSSWMNAPEIDYEVVGNASKRRRLSASTDNDVADEVEVEEMFDTDIEEEDDEDVDVDDDDEDEDDILLSGGEDSDEEESFVLEKEFHLESEDEDDAEQEIKEEMGGKDDDERTEDEEVNEVNQSAEKDTDDQENTDNRGGEKDEKLDDTRARADTDKTASDCQPEANDVDMQET